MKNHLLISCLTVSSILASSAAFAGPAQDAMTPPEGTFMYGVPYGTSGGSDGRYEESETYYNNAPVYTKQGTPGTVWSLYKRADGKWYVDFNAVSEDWDGTIAYAASATTSPWDATWSGTSLVFRNESITASGAAYSSLGSAGTYFFSGQIYNNAPVYQRTASGTAWSIYKRADGKWYFDFNAVAEDWDGTIAYTSAAASGPWSGTWSGSTAVKAQFDQ